MKIEKGYKKGTHIFKKTKRQTNSKNEGVKTKKKRERKKER